jgi:RHS repeat-associated protein
MVTPNKTLWGSKKLEHQEFANGEGLQWYNYDVRPYDAQIGRWHHADLLAEQAPNWSPYRYCYSNPVNYTDPSGLKELPQEQQGIWAGWSNNGSYELWMTTGNWGGGTSASDPRQGGLANLTNGISYGSGNGLLGDYQRQMLLSEGDYTITFGNNNLPIFNTVTGFHYIHHPTTATTTYNGNTLVSYGAISKRATLVFDYNRNSQMGMFGDISNYGNAILNAAGVAYSIAELRLRSLWQGQGPKLHARKIGKGTQETAKMLKTRLNNIKNISRNIGLFGQGLSTINYIANTIGEAELSAGGHANFWIGTAIYAGAVLFSAGAMPAIALTYGILQIGSFLYNQKSLEENFLD